ncbi:MAG: hypothetical protein Q8R33_25640 [Burkholderiales bacterium]|nr:hypothetical protein [Burkholderiales bacterium]
MATALVMGFGTAPAQAAIADGFTGSGSNAPYAGNGELFLAVFDAEAKISYAFDIGVALNDFFIDGQQDAGSQSFWRVNDANWSSFLSQVNATNLRWSVLGFDRTGNAASGQWRLFSTVKQGEEALVSTMTNQLFTLGVGSTQGGTFFGAINQTGTHGAPGTVVDYVVNGSSVNADPDPGNGYFGSNSVGLSSTLNGNAPFDSSNAVGQSSWFNYVTRSGFDQLGTVVVDEFDNLNPGSSGDGYWGFTFVDAALHPSSPYAGSYLLSYTIAPYLTQARIATAEGRARAALTEYSAAFDTRLLNAPAGEFADYAVPLSPVPEPAGLMLLLPGLLLLAARARRSRQR